MTEARQTPVPGAGHTSWWRRAGEGVRLRRERRNVAVLLYRGVVAQARDPFLFRELGVPDTREGRLELVLLHAMLVMRRLSAEGEPGRLLAQDLFDLMFADIDRHMREWGVGDLSVGKRVKAVAQSFFARAAALEAGLEAPDPAGALAPALERNVWGAGPEAPPPPAAAVRRLAAYLLAESAVLGGGDGARLLAGEVAFAPAGAVAGAAGAGGPGPHPVAPGNEAGIPGD